MRAVLHALTDELQRLKSAGVKTVSVTPETVAALRRALGARANSAVAASAGAVALAAPVAAPKPYVPPPMPVRAPAAAPKVAAPALPAPPVVALPDGDKPSRWAALLALVQQDPVCRAHVRPGKKLVLGVGDVDAKIMFVGEAPGAEEEVQGEPFVGPAGQLLTKMIGGMGLQRSQVYIGNLMNWRPEMEVVGGGEQFGNRPPTEEELNYCLPYLRAQIEVVAPALIVALGKTAAQGLLGFRAVKTLGEVRGRWHEWCGTPLMVTYHPSYILREATTQKKRMIWEDLLMVMERAALPISDKQRRYFLEK
ncbi:MAG: hypothetical protein RLZZ15_4238 [Verrucomicrobiota bacterium]